ncbi:DUF4214 domain-containing protein [Paenibacillus lupini]|uniref:DUF4214 domain-containing protein n=1 Tax=Paenibacillus lupini TaxID=1450204 RepID=UPI001421F007|nr:DUF4214 domain-containing protein [Paenibacillus lupini]NIK25503.1 hypothetical protein [Paenibacillus lupini]
MKRKKKRKSLKRSTRSRLARSKRRKSGKPKKLSRRKGKRRLRGKKTGRRKKKSGAALEAQTPDPHVVTIPAEDIARLRANNTRVRGSLLEGSRIIEWFHFIFRLDNEDFIWEMYRQILQREPDANGFYDHKQRLESGMPRVSMAASLVQSSEAEQIFMRQPSGDRNTAAFIIQSLYPAHTLDYIHGIYAQLLYREPDAARVNYELMAVNQGMPRHGLLARLLVTEEVQSLLRAANMPMPRTAAGGKNGNKNIGIFLCFGSQIAMDGEGIGRFIVRLTEGLLALENSYTLHVATTEANYRETETIFSGLRAVYSDRIRLYHSDSMETINQTVPADVWIVPYVGMGLAQYLQRPYIVCLHDLVYLHFPNLYAKDMDHYQYIHSLAEKITKNAAIVVFDSEYIRNHEGLSFLSLPVHQTEVVRFAAPHEEYTSFGSRTELEFRSKYNLFGPYLTFPSVIRLHKNHERLIDAFHRFRLTDLGRASGLKLVFTDDLNNRPRQQEITAALNVIGDAQTRSSIIFMGRIPSADLPSLYKYANGVIVPTLFEGSCPFPIVESLLMDTPVSFGRLSVVQEVIPDMSSFATFDPLNPIEMSGAIARLYMEGKSVVPQQKAASGGLLQRSWADVAADYAAIIGRIS